MSAVHEFSIKPPLGLKHRHPRRLACPDQIVIEGGERQAEREAPARPQHSPAEAAARIRELRKGNMLPAGATIKDLINYGRA